MVYLLVGESGSAAVEPALWTSAVELGRRFGWSPGGTIRDARWRGSYVRPCGQLVAARDASSLALALEDALDDLPDHDVPRTAGAADLLQRLGGARKPDVLRLVTFLRGGAFMIHARCDAHGAGAAG